MKNYTKIILLILSLSFSLLAKDVATVTAINGEAFIQRDNAKVEVTLGIKLQEKDTIITAKKAKVQLIFSDETIITIGKNSEFSISEYLFEDTQKPVVKFSMIKGAMRTITGKIGKIAPEKFTVIAKTTTIGIRGTNFTIDVSDSGITQVYCTFGAISTTVNGIQHIVNQGFFIAIYPDGKTEIKAFQPEDLKIVKTKFTKPTKKVGAVNDDAAPSNQAQIDTTTEDFDNIIIKDISDVVRDSNQIDLESTIDVSLADLLAGYTMNDAVYNGTYIITDASGGGQLAGNNGTALLEIDFGNDTIDLTLTSSSGGIGTFTQNPSFSNTGFTVEQTTPSAMIMGSANGTFNGTSGNNVTGTFKLNSNSSDYDNGTFNVTSSQTLK